MDMQMGCWDTCQSWKRSCLELAGRFSEILCDLVVVHKRHWKASLLQFIPSAKSEALFHTKEGLPVPLCSDLRMGLVREGSTFGFASCEAAQGRFCFEWITWAREECTEICLFTRTFI